MVSLHIPLKMLDALKKIALIGTERAEISDTLQKNIAQLGITDTADAATFTLHALAMHAKAAQARIHFADKKLNLPAPCAAEPKLYVPEKIMEYFFQQVGYLRLRHDTQFNALLHLLSLVKEKGMVIPPSYVVEVLIFSKIKAEKEPRAKLPILETIGEHGKWFLYNSSDYKKIAQQLPQKIDKYDFATDTKEERISLFEQQIKELLQS
jgi:hypothetical protein